MPLDGSGSSRILLALPGVQVASHWSPDGRHIATVDIGSASPLKRQIILVSMEGSQSRLRDTPAELFDPRFSPDGRHIAFVSNESGNADVYVAPFGAAGPSRRLSRAGGFMPRWRADGRELFFEQPDGTFAAVDPFAETPAPQLLFSVAGATLPDSEFPRNGPSVDYDVSRDGQRFLVRLRNAEAAEGLHVARNWLPSP